MKVVRNIRSGHRSSRSIYLMKITFLGKTCCFDKSVNARSESADAEGRGGGGGEGGVPNQKSQADADMQPATNLI